MSLLPAKSKFDEYVKMGLIRSQTEGDLTIYQYTELTQFDRLWNGVTLAARGIVFDKDGTVVQRCFPKFFNSDEPEGIVLSKTVKPTKLAVYEKLDGSLIKVTFDTKHGLVVTSKASFNSDQAKWALEIIDEEGYEFSQGVTYHFELIHPSNQIVLNYGDRRELVLLAVVDNETGKEYSLHHVGGFKKVKKLPDEIIKDVNKLNENGFYEGVVVDFGSYRLKMKTDEYVRLHRIVTDFTPKRVWEALSAGQMIERQNIPEEFLKWLEATEKELLLAYSELFDKVNQALVDSAEMTNKEVALTDDEGIKSMKHYIFASRSGKDISQMIWKAIKPKGGENEQI